VIAYRELRELEIAVLRERFEQVFNRPGMTRGEYDFDVASLSKINVDQFYGIELKEFPVRIAEVAMWMAERIRLVAQFRRGEIPARKIAEENDEEAEPKTRGKGTVEMANVPTQFHVTVLPTAPFLVIPESSSQRREYVPIGWLEPPTIPSNLVRIVPDADLWDFGLITSRMHMAWLRNIGGRLKSDYRYSIGIVYNPFPIVEAMTAETR
jgi:hypothetical protein